LPPYLRYSGFGSWAMAQDPTDAIGGGRVTSQYFAHSASREGAGEWQSLNDHLVGTAALARVFGERIGIPQLTEAAAVLHDVGKYSDDFQRYLSDAAALVERKGPRARLVRSVDHKLLGASAATAIDSSPMGVLLALLIAGHHGGLLDREDAQTQWRAIAADTVVDRAKSDEISAALPLSSSIANEVALYADPLSTDLLLRMAFSCLVDADHLDTEAHFEPSKTARRGSDLDVGTLLERLKSSQSALVARSEPTRVNKLRAEVEHAHPGSSFSPRLGDHRQRGCHVSAEGSRHRTLPLPRGANPNTMVERDVRDSRKPLA